MRRRENPRQQLFIARALEATLHLRQAQLTYHSKSSDRTKTYLVHPYRLAYADGGMYLLAYVPEYQEVRTFAIERIHDVSLLEERFTPIEELPDAAFPHSLGVHRERPNTSRSRSSRRSSTTCAPASGIRRSGCETARRARCIMTLDVCRDRALQSWILSFGPFARVVAPVTLAREIAEQLAEATARYAS